MPRSCSAARQCHRGGRRRFHRHAHRRVMPHGGGGSYRPRERSRNTAVSSQDQVHPQPQTRGAQCAHADPHAPGLTARRATPPTPSPSRPRLGQGPRLAQAAQLWQAQHVAWAAWCAVALVTTTRGRLRHLAWPYPAATALVVLAPANHFPLDAAGGLAVAGLGMLATSRVQPAADTPPGRRLHGRTEAQALGDADVC